VRHQPAPAVDWQGTALAALSLQPSSQLHDAAAMPVTSKIVIVPKVITFTITTNAIVGCSLKATLTFRMFTVIQARNPRRWKMLLPLALVN
jgi:hypothetical protein